MNAQIRPERLFRYFPPEASDFFSAKKLWFSAVRDYNDPFDALPRFDAMLHRQSEHAIRVEYAFLPPHASRDWTDFKKEMSRDAAAFNVEGAEAVSEKHVQVVSEGIRSVCFFTGFIDKLLMWSHYASSHNGFVVEFNPKHPLFATDEFGEVHYANERPDVEATPSKDLGEILFAKSCEWKDEHEWRLVQTINSLKCATRRDGKTLCYLDLPPDSVRAVYLGCRIPAGCCVELLDSLKKEYWKDVNKFVMCRHQAEYAIEAIPWEQWRTRPDTYRPELDRLVAENVAIENSKQAIGTRTRVA